VHPGDDRVRGDDELPSRSELDERRIVEKAEAAGTR